MRTEIRRKEKERGGRRSKARGGKKSKK